MSAYFRRKRASPTNHCWYQKTSVSQNTRVTDRQNYDSQDRTSIAAHAVKTGGGCFHSLYTHKPSILNSYFPVYLFSGGTQDGGTCMATGCKCLDICRMQDDIKDADCR